MKPLYILATCKKSCSKGKPQIKALIYKGFVKEKDGIYYRFDAVCLRCRSKCGIKQNKQDIDEILDAMNLFKDFWDNLKIETAQ